MLERDPFSVRVRCFLGPGWILTLSVLALVGAGLWGAFGPGSDVRMLRVRLVLDGAAPGHVFHSGTDLGGIHLADRDLSDAVFNAVSLRDAALSRCLLRRARFFRCDLTGANLNGADLSGAWIKDSILERANLVDVNLSGADLRGTRLQNALMDKARLSGADIAQADFTGVVGFCAQQVLSCSNWHLARFDTEAARLLAQSGQADRIASPPDFSSWDAWLHEQERAQLSSRSPPKEDPPSKPN